MNKAKKTITSFILILCVALSIISVNASYTDVKQEDTYYSPISLLSALGIIKGYDDGTFGPEKNVTRAEFTVMLMRTLGSSGANSNDLSNMPFSDVADVADWAGGDIKSAYGLGIINGTSKDTFAPNDEVTFEQALKMIVCALGYEPMALDKVGGDKTKIYPDGYLIVATILKLDKGLSVKQNTPAKRGEIAQMIYNALDVKLMRGSSALSGINYDISDETILSDKLDIKFGFGEIRANDKASIEDGKIARSGEVLILPDGSENAETMYTGNVDTTGLVGMNVKYYYKEADNLDKTLVYVESRTKDTSIIKINTEDIESVGGDWGTGYKIEYWENKSDRTPVKVDIKKESNIAVNGRAVSKPDANVLKPNSGFIEVIDSNNDGDYDTVNVTSYETYVVSMLNMFDNQVSDMFRKSSESKIITIDKDDPNKSVSIINAETNESMELSDIKKWNVLSVKESNSLTGKDVLEVNVSTKTVEGAIKELDKANDTVKIDDKEYTLSYYFKTYCKDDYESLSVSDSGKFYLDNNGEVCAFDKSKSSINQYGYISGVEIDAKSGRLLLNLISFEKDSTATAIKSSSRVTLDGKLYSDMDTLEKDLEAISTGSYVKFDENDIPKVMPNTNGNQLIIYSVNSEGEINSIDTASAAGGTLTPYKNNSSQNWKFNKMSSSFKDLTHHEFFMNSNTKIVFVPSLDRTEYEDYEVKDYKSSLFDKDDDYKLEAFDVKGSPEFASVVLVYRETADNPIGKKSPVAVVTDIKSVVRLDGVVAQQLTAYVVGKDDAGNEATTFYTESEGTLEGVEVGDVIRFATTKEGYIKDGEIQLLVDVSTPTIDPFTTDSKNQPLIPPKYIDCKDSVEYNTNNTGYDYRVVHGLLYAASDDNSLIEVVPTGNRTADGVNSAISSKYSFAASKDTMFFTYDATLPKNKVTAQGNSLPLSGYPSYYDGTEGTDDSALHATEIFTYECEANVYVVYAIRR